MLFFKGALAYAELGTMNTSSGAEYAYYMDAFGAPPAFIFSWASTLVLKPSQMAIICLSFGKYFVEAFVSECEPPEIVVKMVALLAMGKTFKITYKYPKLKICSTLFLFIEAYVQFTLLQTILCKYYNFHHSESWALNYGHFLPFIIYYPGIFCNFWKHLFYASVSETLFLFISKFFLWSSCHRPRR